MERQIDSEEREEGKQANAAQQQQQNTSVRAHVHATVADVQYFCVMPTSECNERLNVMCA